mmetsp:Transcript_13945/g.41866  ORF Transcript_13945/g.41866 Transcript_13945/m.41866 type:complete len:279 (+) Transcript_13945:718-1554(+)
MRLPLQLLELFVRHDVFVTRVLVIVSPRIRDFRRHTFQVRRRLAQHFKRWRAYYGYHASFSNRVAARVRLREERRWDGLLHERRRFPLADAPAKHRDEEDRVVFGGRGQQLPDLSLLLNSSYRQVWRERDRTEPRDRVGQRPRLALRRRVRRGPRQRAADQVPRAEHVRVEAERRGGRRVGIERFRALCRGRAREASDARGRHLHEAELARIDPNPDVEAEVLERDVAQEAEHDRLRVRRERALAHAARRVAVRVVRVVRGFAAALPGTRGHLVETSA